MTPEQAFLEGVFATKNKAYGAYQLRKRYHRNLLLGFVAGVLTVGIGFAWPLLEQWLEDRQVKEEPIRMKDKKVVRYSELSAPPPIEQEKPPPQMKPRKAKTTKKFLPPKVKPDEEVPDEELMPTQEELKEADPGVADVAGDGLEVEYEEEEVVVAEAPPKPEPEPEEPKEEKIFMFVEEQATFPGGNRALFRYLSENIKYPEFAKATDIQGKVIVEFVVEGDGSITQARVLRGIGGGCDKEALRVIRKMPNWQPAQQNDRKVRSRMVLPLSFKLQ